MTQHPTPASPDFSAPHPPPDDDSPPHDPSPGDAPRRRRPRRSLLVALAVAGTALLVAALVLFEPWRLITRSTVDEAAPAASQVLGEGRFVDAEHATSGTARIVELADGSRSLRLEGFSTSDGPDVDVWLTDQPAGGDWHSYDDGVHVALGDLKATDGNQNYAIPAGVDLSRLTSVVIWCDRFDVAFGTAPIRIA